ncbi:MAG: hypothetical protein JW881_13240 [Spirochaetales bacterium]|nr:hypothetical protein [Spirochaetales bacterium]
MGAENPFLATPVLWLVASGFFLGAAFSRLTISIKNRKNPEAALNRKWVMICIYLSIAIIMGLCAILVPGPQKIKNLNLLILYVGTTIVFFFAFRFKRAFGIPFFLLFMISCIVILLFIQSITAFTGEVEIARIHVLAVNTDIMKMEVIPNGHDPVFLEMEGSSFAPVVKVIIFDDLLVFLGAKTWYRFIGMSSYRKVKSGEIAVQAGIHEFDRPDGISERLYSLFEAYEEVVPGLKSVQTDVIQKKAKESGLYSVRVQNDGGVEVILMND